jgi:hypothetical protein
MSTYRRKSLLTAAALSIGLLALPIAARAQTATLQGYLSNFDVVNETGQDAHGFEIRLEGATLNDLYYTASGQQYGAAIVAPYATGVTVRWESPYNANSHSYAKRTPQHTPGAPYSWNDCYQAGATYATAGCEALGQGLRPSQNVITATGRWLIEDSQNPGTLIPAEPNVAIPFPSWSVIGGAVGASPTVVAQVEAPEPPETPEVFGNAQWVKVYKTQLTREATPEDLTSNNPIVPQDAAQLEVAWDILQASPPSNGNQTRHRNQGTISPDTRAIIRRYETYAYTGAYDATTHKVACADGTCTAPSAGELGGFIAAQNSAVNVIPDALTVTRTGSGTVNGSNNKINCGNLCSVFTTNGTTLSLTAIPGGNVFTGWTGACTGTELTCTIPVNGAMQVGAKFQGLYTLSVGRSNSGTVTATPSGTDRAINCGSNCSAKFLDSTAITLTATPPAGKTFVSWGGACSGTALTCTILIGKNTSVQANFGK